MSIARLRRDLPSWSWRAVRYGLGWRYEGHLGDRRATVVSYGEVCGPAEDDMTTVWRVYETGQPYAVWLMHELAGVG